MLNVKYFIGQQRGEDGSVQVVAQLNPDYLPKAWFVDSVVVTRSKAETFVWLNSPTWNPRITALLEKELPTSISRPDSGVVKITKYGSREITFSASTPKTCLLVVSEIYYPAGWKAYIDGSETEIYKTNHILRSVLVPPGSHTVEFRFDPPGYQFGYAVTQSAWGVSIFLILAGIARLPAVRQKLGLTNKGEKPTSRVSPS